MREPTIDDDKAFDWMFLAAVTCSVIGMFWKEAFLIAFLLLFIPIISKLLYTSSRIEYFSFDVDMNLLSKSESLENVTIDNMRDEKNKIDTSLLKTSTKKSSLADVWGLPTLRIRDSSGQIITANPDTPVPIGKE